MNFLRNIIETLGTKVVLIFCGVISGMITARWLGPNGRGVLAIVTVLPATIWMLSSFGINQANVYYIGKKKFKLSGIISNAVIFPLLMGLVVCGLLWGTRDYFIIRFIPLLDSYYLILILSLVPTMLVQNSLLGVLRGVEKFSLINIRQGLRTIVGLLCTASILVWFNMGVKEVVYGIITIEFLNTLWLLYEINKISVIRIHLNKVLSRNVFRFGIKSYIQNMIGFLHNRIDLFIIAYFLSSSQVAFYDISVILGEMLLILPQTLTFVILPKLVKLDSKDKISVSLRAGRISLTIITFAALVLVITGKWLIATVYGTDYVNAYLPLCILLPGLILSCLNSVIIPYYTSEHRQKVTIAASMVSLVVNIILNILLIPKFGINGAAFSTTLTYSLFTMMMVVVFTKESKFKIHNILFINKDDIGLLMRLIKTSLFLYRLEEKS